MRHAALAIEGILRDPLTGAPDDQGRDLYHALCNNYRLTLMADSADAQALDWLLFENFSRHTRLIVSSKEIKSSESRLHQVRVLRAQGAVDLVVIADPTLLTDLYDMGQPVLLYVNPKSLGQLPPRSTWQDLAARVDETRARAAQALQHEDP